MCDIYICVCVAGHMCMYDMTYGYVCQDICVALAATTAWGGSDVMLACDASV